MKREIEICLYRIIGPLTAIVELKSFAKYKNGYNKALSIIKKWTAIYFEDKSLKYITREEILYVFNLLNDLESDALYDSSIGYESFLANEVMIWYWELMELRKKEIENGR